jgi:hypothetical protein
LLSEIVQLLLVNWLNSGGDGEAAKVQCHRPELRT